MGSSPDGIVSVTFVLFDALHKPIGSSEAGPLGAALRHVRRPSVARSCDSGHLLAIPKCGGPATFVGIERSGATTYMTIPNNSTSVQYVIWRGAYRSPDFLAVERNLFDQAVFVVSRGKPQ